MENANLQNTGGTPQPVPLTPSEQPAVPQTAEPQTEPLKKPGYWSLVGISFQIVFKNILQFLKLTLTLLIPVLVVGGLLFLFVDNQAQAAPKLPTETKTAEATTEVTAPPPVVETEVAPKIENESGKPEIVKEAVSPSALPNGEDSNAKLIYELMKYKSETPSSRLITGLSGTTLGAILAKLKKVLTILSLPLTVYIFFAILAFIRLTVLIAQGQMIKIGEVLKWSLKKFGSYLFLLMRIFIYTFAWVCVIASIPNLFYSSDLFAIIITIVYVIGFLLVVIRGPRTLFSHYILAEKDCTSKEAMHESVKVSIGYWKIIISYWLSMIIMIQILGAIGFYLFQLIHLIAGMVALSIFVLIGIYVTFVFMFALYNYLKLIVSTKQA